MVDFLAFLKQSLRCVEAGTLFSLYSRLDLVEGDRILDLLVIVRVVAF